MLIKFAQRQERLNLSVEQNIKPLYWRDCNPRELGKLVTACNSRFVNYQQK